MRSSRERSSAKCSMNGQRIETASTAGCIIACNPTMRSRPSSMYLCWRNRCSKMEIGRDSDRGTGMLMKLRWVMRSRHRCRLAPWIAIPWTTYRSTNGLASRLCRRIISELLLVSCCAVGSCYANAALKLLKICARAEVLGGEGPRGNEKLYTVGINTVDSNGSSALVCIHTVECSDGRNSIQPRNIAPPVGTQTRSIAAT